jgi:hypothetical protein
MISLPKRTAIIVGLAVVIVVASTVIALAVTRSSKPSADETATASYVRAKTSLERRIAANARAGEYETHQWASAIMARCPAKSAGPDNDQAAKLRLVILNGMGDAGTERQDHRAVLQFDRQVSGLRWSDRRIAPLIRASTVQEQMATSIPVPRLSRCRVLAQKWVSQLER